MHQLRKDVREGREPRRQEGAVQGLRACLRDSDTVAAAGAGAHGSGQPVGDDQEFRSAGVRARRIPAPSYSAVPSYADAVADPYGLEDVPIALPEPEPEFATIVADDDEIAFPGGLHRPHPSPTGRTDPHIGMKAAGSLTAFPGLFI